MVDGLLSLRDSRAYNPIQSSIAAAHKCDFRITDFSCQHDHVHLIVEADDKKALRRGISGFKIRAARAINRSLGRTGKVWADRYHARPLRTPTQTRNAIAYVLTNRKHHAPAASRLDGRSSGPWFEGWAKPMERARSPSPCARAETWLGSVGWKRQGLI